jgi:hypothetical protein
MCVLVVPARMALARERHEAIKAAAGQLVAKDDAADAPAGCPQ